MFVKFSLLWYLDDLTLYYFKSLIELVLSTLSQEHGQQIFKQDYLIIDDVSTQSSVLSWSLWGVRGENGGNLYGK